MNNIKTRLWTAFQCFLLFAIMWACQASLHKLHSLGLDVWQILNEALFTGAVFAVIVFFVPQRRAN